jgi:hypothetical protein
MEGLRPPEQMFLLLDSQHVSAQTDNHNMIIEEYTNGDGEQTTMIILH